MVDLTLLIVQDYDAMVQIGLRTLLKEQGPKGTGQKNAMRQIYAQFMNTLCTTGDKGRP